MEGRMKSVGIGLWIVILLGLFVACTSGGGTNPPPPPPPPQAGPPPPPAGPPPPPPPPTGTDITGTLTAPTGKTVEGTYVTACPFINNQTDCASTDTVQIQIPTTQRTQSASYKMTLKTGQWVVNADKDVDGDNKFRGNGDYTSCFGEQGNTCLLVQPPKGNVDIQMRVIGGSTPPPPPPPPAGPPPPPGSGEVSGTVSAPTGKTVESTFITFCPVTATNTIDCKSTDTTFTQIPANQSTASAPYKFSLKAGKWVVFADKDADGDGFILGNGDYTGCYGAQGNTCLIVEPPKSGVNIQMQVINQGAAQKGQVLGPQQVNRQKAVRLSP
jgi:uncharacterized protein (DUF2141 family)